MLPMHTSVHQALLWVLNTTKSNKKIYLACSSVQVYSFTKHLQYFKLLIMFQK